MANVTPIPISVDLCAECVFVNANGANDLHELSSWTGFLPEWQLTMFADRPCADGDCEGHFSWSPCGGCGSGLGGMRFCYYAVNIIYPEVDA